QVCIDSGATANTIDCATYEAISAAKTVPLKPTNVKRHPHGEDNPAPIPLAGLFFGMINTPSGKMDLTRFLKFPKVFIGKIEKLKDYQLEPNIDSTVQPVLQKSHPAPLHCCAKVEANWTNRNQYCGIFKGLIRTWKHLVGSPSRTEAGGIMDGKIEDLKKEK
ncbi:unnamed protein product, partial [Porites lobata]